LSLFSPLPLLNCARTNVMISVSLAEQIDPLLKKIENYLSKITGIFVSRM
jgi:hypothetical protein